MSFTFHKPIPVVCFLLLYHIPPLFSIVLRRPSRCFYMFGIQIPVDACSPFGLKRRSFLFVIDKKGLSEHRRIEKRYSDSFYFTKRRDAMKCVPSLFAFRWGYRRISQRICQRHGKIARKHFTDKDRVRLDKEFGSFLFHGTIFRSKIFGR